MKKLLLSAALAATMTGAHADVINLPGGIVFDEISPAAVGDGTFETDLAFVQWFQDTSGGATSLTSTADDVSISSFDFSVASSNLANFELVGVGELGVENTFGGIDPVFLAGLNTGQPVCSFCELTFEFGGISLLFADTDGNDSYGLGEIGLDISNAFLRVYLDADGATAPDSFAIGDVVPGADTLDTTEVGNAIDGVLWLDLKIVETDYDPDVSLTNALFGGLQSGDASFALEAVGGLAETNFNTNGVLGSGATSGELSALFFDAVAFGLSSSFNVNSLGIANTYSQESVGTVQARPIPEPGTLALLGLGLVCVGGLVRRKRSV